MQGTDESGDWNQEIKSPEVSYLFGQYFMVFTGYNYDVNNNGDSDISDYSADGIGITVSSKPEEEWRRPIRIVRRSELRTAWDYGYVGNCSPLIFDPIERSFHLWYVGCNILSGQIKPEERKAFYFGYAFTDKNADPMSPNCWHKFKPDHPKGYVFAPSDLMSAFDSDEIFSPCVFFNDNSTPDIPEDDFFEMYYTAYSKQQGVYSIGYTQSHTRLEDKNDNIQFGAIWDKPRYLVYAENEKNAFTRNIYRPIRKVPVYYVFSRK